MPRAPIGLSLLLMAGLVFAASPHPQLVNPWLTSADLLRLQQQNYTGGTCSATSFLSEVAAKTTTTATTATTATAVDTASTATGADASISRLINIRSSTSCPPPCPANSIKNTTTQCLYYLEESHKEEVCGREVGVERRRQRLHGLRMRHCCEHHVDMVLPEAAFQGGHECRRMLSDLMLLDRMASDAVCTFADLLTRYDCGQTYSIAHRCQDCKEAYRRWVCSSVVPHFTRSGKRIRPCLSVCQDVEQQCPYLVPGDWTNLTLPPWEYTTHPIPQYAGEPTFLCLDPNIPEMGEQKRRSARGDEDCCYTHCRSAGRGHLDVCEHCPGRPPPPSRGNVPRTYPNTVLLWTAWIIIQNRTIYNLLKCLLVMCASTVRTTIS